MVLIAELDKAIVDFTNNKTSKRERIECDKVLVAIGRKPNFGNLDLTKLGIKLNNEHDLWINSDREFTLLINNGSIKRLNA